MLQVELKDLRRFMDTKFLFFSDLEHKFVKICISKHHLHLTGVFWADHNKKKKNTLKCAV